MKMTSVMMLASKEWNYKRGNWKRKCVQEKMMEDELTMLSTLYTRYSLRPLRLADGAPVGITVSHPSSSAQSDTRWESGVQSASQ